MRISDWSSDVCSSDLGGRDPGNELAVLNQPVDPPLDAFDGNTLQTKVERGLAELVDRPSRLAFGQYAHRRGDSELRTRFRRCLNRARERIVDPRIVRTEQRTHPVTGTVHSIDDRAIRTEPRRGGKGCVSKGESLGSPE